MVAFLLEHGPSRVKDIAVGVRARRDVVADLLTQEPFTQVERPEGAHPHSVYHSVSLRVPRITEGSRGWLLLSILQDGAWHGRDEIFEAAGRSFLTNNAAAELRRAGHAVEYSARHGYRLVSLAAPEGVEAALPPSGAASETRVAVVA